MNKRKTISGLSAIDGRPGISLMTRLPKSSSTSMGIFSRGASTTVRVASERRIRAVSRTGMDRFYLNDGEQWQRRTQNAERRTHSASEHNEALSALRSPLCAVRCRFAVHLAVTLLGYSRKTLY